MKRSTLTWIIVGGVILLCVFFVGLFALMAVASDDEGFFAGSGDRIAVVPVEGVIDDGMAKTVNRHLKQYGEDSRVKAIILRIDSPGGGVSASQEIYREVVRLKQEKDKKVIVSMGSVAASGGYYIAAPADRIFANQGTITGSIGVIAEWINYKDLAEWAKIKPVVFKSGEFKDTGSPTRDLTDRDKEFFQGLITELYGQFLGAVTDGRKGKGVKDNILDDEKIKALADGRVYSGEAAVKNGLVDEIGNYEDAVKETAKLIGMKGEPKIVTPPKPKEGFSLLDLLLSTTKFKEFSPSQLPKQLSDFDTSMKFKYQWK
ncbi:MAG: signal peptide peptidase SppA [Acidobacteria bacterium]|nr:signal peptide peptidase SppA [Acidobacteriota bacterium]